VVDLVRSGRCSKALDLLGPQNAPINVMTDPTALQALRDLHPPSSDQDSIPELPQTTPSLTLQEATIKEILSTAPKDSAVAFSAWTFELLNFGIQYPAFLTAATKIFNHMLAGRAGNPALWLQSRLVALRKPNGGVRPIAVGEAWPRALGRIVAKVCSSALQDFFLPLQLGVGTAGGAESIIHCTKLFHESIIKDPSSNNAILTIDYRNAFNCVRRGAITAALPEELSNLRSFLHWSYGAPTPLLSGNGEVICQSSTGVRQGDPLGPALFSIALQPILLKLAEAFPNIKILGYMDDTTLLGPQDDLLEALTFIAEESTAIGLQVNRQKCHLLSRSAPADLQDVQHSSQGLTLLGAPIGSTSYIQEAVRDSFVEMTSPLDEISAYSVDIAFPLIQACINARPQFLLRTTAPWLIDDQCQQFDDAIDSSLSKILGESIHRPLPPTARAIRALPLKQGGLGLRLTSEIRHPAWASSWTRAMDFLEETYDEYYSKCVADNIDLTPHLRSLRIAHRKDDLFTTPLSVLDTNDEVRLLKQKALSQLLAEHNKTALLTQLFTEGRRAEAHWLNSNGNPGTNTWIFSTFARPPNRLTTDEYRENMRLRLLLPIVDNVRRCSCGITADFPHDPLADPFHPMNCIKINGPRIYRHNKIAEELADYIEKAYANPHVTLNPVIHTNAEGRQIIADVQYVRDHHTTNIDVAVACPSAPKYLATSLESMLTNIDIACNSRHNLKTQHYASLCPSTIADTVVPFTLDSTGRLSAKAQDLIDRIFCLDLTNAEPNRQLGAARRRLLRRISTICAKATASSIRIWRATAPVMTPSARETQVRRRDDI
jgi:hypothetical protein